jgi:indole-3-glycerol phosphate synthase
MDRNARGILQTIVAAKQREVERLRSARRDVEAALRDAPATRAFAPALRAAHVQVIAEFKRRSPSAGWIREAARIAEIAPAYTTAGAAALSILTDHEFFGGSLVDLEEARKVSRLPLLRKDFIIDELQVQEARAAGADAILLIVRILTPDQLRYLLQVAEALTLGVLVETHDAGEVQEAVAAGAQVIGINNRDLSSFQTDTRRAFELLSGIPADVCVVAESGIRTRMDVEAYGAAGFDAVLVGETLMRENEPARAVQQLANCPRAARLTAARA